MEQPDASLQLILPTDKRNPCFTLYLTEDRRFLHVYYGLERLEVVPAAADHPAHRMLVARLYNADVKVAVLEELFDLDHKTIRAWGLALDSGDPEALQRMLFGAPRKLTPAIREFIAQRWPQLRAQRCRNHREVLQNEIKTYFGVSLSGESLRIMMNQLTGAQARAQAQGAAVPEVSAPADAGSAPASDAADAAHAAPELDLFAPVAAPPQSTDEPAPTLLSPPQTHEIVEVVEVVPYPGFGEWTCVSQDGSGAGETPPDEPQIPDSNGFSAPLENGGEAPVPDWFESKFDPWPWQPKPSPQCSAGISNNSASPSYGAMISISIPTPNTTPACSACSRVGAPPSAGPTR